MLSTILEYVSTILSTMCRLLPTSLSAIAGYVCDVSICLGDLSTMLSTMLAALSTSLSIIVDYVCGVSAIL